MSSENSRSSSTSAFARLHRTLQEPLYRMAWTHLRPIQVQAIHEIFDGPGDLILAARTASGKTEAAFLPILSKLAENPHGGVRAVYAGPLKALINDQFLRLEQLCEQAEIPVHKWHGDVSAKAKQRLLKQPSGVLLITPESIESLFVNHPGELAAVFAHLGFIVIDEMHSFIGTERGAHLRSLTARLASQSTQVVRRLGLSATLGDLDAARRWLRPADPDGVAVIEDHEEKQILLKLSGYLVPRSGLDEEDDAANELGRFEDVSLFSDVFEAFQGKSALIFGNRKELLERCADYAVSESRRKGLANRFRIHHGSLSKSEREETEDALRSEPGIATFCSSTLEMGIDVGNVKMVGQIGPPWSVNSLAQRLGRSGRKEGEASVIRIFIDQEEPGPHNPLIDRLFPGLLQAIAMTELMLGRWCEPPEVDRLHLSTLVQQVMSVIAAQGGATPAPLYKTLVTHGGFPGIDQPTFGEVLRSMGAADLIEQTPEGLLILGLKGEKIVRRYDFYVSFLISEEYRVVHEGRHVGNIAWEFGGAEEYLILAGRRWKVLEIDFERKVIVVEPSDGGHAPRFSGRAGFDVHPKVREMMRSLIARDDFPVYLDPTAKKMLADARKTGQEANIVNNPFFQEVSTLLWMTWTGSRIQRTLHGLGHFFGGLDVRDDGIALTIQKSSEARVKEAYRAFLEKCPAVEAIAAHCPGRAQQKYEPFLSDTLLARNYARNGLDLPGALQLIRQL
jgi:ATP-dependent helicase Lhr and Lhr-like helicase